MNDNEQKWIYQLKHEHDLYKKHLKVLEDELLEYKEAARSEADEVNRLQAENKRIREALEFYADEETWLGERVVGYPIALDDEGKKATEALKEITTN